MSGDTMLASAAAPDVAHGDVVARGDVDADARPVSRVRRWAMATIVWYQRAVDGRPSPCRFTPSCSAYALESFETHATGRAFRLTLRRFTKCRPFGPTGYDPVPEPAPTGAVSSRDRAACTHTSHSHEDC